MLVEFDVKYQGSIGKCIPSPQCNFFPMTLFSLSKKLSLIFWLLKEDFFMVEKRLVGRTDDAVVVVVVVVVGDVAAD